MIDLDTFKSELTALEPGLSEITVGAYSGFSYVTRTPAHTFHCFDLYVPQLGFLHIVARDSFRDDLLAQLVAVFERTRKKRYKKSKLHVYHAYELDGFDCAGLAPPPLAKVYDTRSATLAKHGYWLFPMHGLEFLDGFTQEQFWTQLRRKDRWRVSIVDWSRRIELTKSHNNGPAED